MKEFISKLFVFIGKANSEGVNPSNIRVLAFYAHFLLIPTLAFATIYAVIVGKDVVALAGIDTAYLFGIAGVKAYQKGKEDAT